MIHGACTRRASAKRTSAERTTIPVSHAQTGTARTSDRAGAPSAALATKPDLSERVREPLRVVEADVRRAGGDLVQELLAHGGPARGLLERGCVEIGHPR